MAPKDKERPPRAEEAHAANEARRAEREAAHAERQADEVRIYDPGDGTGSREVTIISKDRGMRTVRDVATGEELTVPADHLSRPDEDEGEMASETPPEGA